MLPVSILYFNKTKLVRFPKLIVSGAGGVPTPQQSTTNKSVHNGLPIVLESLKSRASIRTMRVRPWHTRKHSQSPKINDIYVKKSATVLLREVYTAEARKQDIV